LSHSKERHEKNCLNCNAEVIGRYCHVCGQENIEPKETVWSLISHFFYDITHFDGKFFSTTKFLITRPGFLPKEYIEGRRARYLHPIRMYVFSSALFFICFYSLFHVNVNDGSEKDRILIKKAKQAKATIDSARLAAMSEATNSQDSVAIDRAFAIATLPYVKTMDSINDWELRTDTAGTTDKFKKKYMKKREKRTKKNDDDDDNEYNINLVGAERRYSSIEQYDSVQKALPEKERDNWIERHAKHREIELNERYDGNQKAMMKDLLEKFVHTFPYLLFVSLPLYAWYLRLLYRRQKQQFPYVTHGIFLIYLYIFTFIDLLVYFILNKIHESMDWGWLGWIEAVILLYGVYYAYKAMRKFYGQRRGKTILKFIILNFCAFWSIIILFMAFFLFAAFKF
jgi:ribonuclease HI